MNEKEISLQRNTLFNTMGSMFYLACQWLITILVVKLGSYEAAGDLSLAMTNTNIFFSLATFGLHDFQITDYNDKYAPGQYIATRITTCCAALLICILYLFSFSHFSSYQIVCIGLYMTFRVAEAFVDVLQTIQQKAARMDFVAKSFFMRGFLLLLGFSVVLKLSGSLLFAICSITITSFAVILLYDLHVAKHLTSFILDFNRIKMRGLLVECLPLMCNSFLLNIINAIPRNTLEAQYGNYILGIYASIATPAAIIQSAAQWLYTPTLTTFTKHYQEKNKKAFFKLYRTMWLVFLVCIIIALAGALLLGKFVLTLLFNDKIVPYTYLLIPVMIVTMSIAVVYFLSAIITITRKFKVIIVGNAVALAIVAIFSGTFITHFAVDGVNYVLFCAYGANILVLFTVLTIVLLRHFSTADTDDTNVD